MLGICIFVAGFIVGGLAGMAVMALASAASRGDRRTQEITDK